MLLLLAYRQSHADRASYTAVLTTCSLVAAVAAAAVESPTALDFVTSATLITTHSGEYWLKLFAAAIKYRK